MRGQVQANGTKILLADAQARLLRNLSPHESQAPTPVYTTELAGRHNVRDPDTMRQMAAVAYARAESACAMPTLLK